MNNKGYVSAKLATLIGTIVSIVAYGFTTFATKHEVESVKNDVVKRLERIEDKIDKLKE